MVQLAAEENWADWVRCGSEREVGAKESWVDGTSAAWCSWRQTRTGRTGFDAAVREKWRRGARACDEVTVVAVQNRGAGLQQVKADDGGWARRWVCRKRNWV